MVERRSRRSHDPLVALHYKLSATRRDGGLDALVVADADGLVIAGAGAWPLCEEVAAYAPMLGESEASVPSRLAGRVQVRGGGGLWVCAVREEDATHDDSNLDWSGLEHAVSRILAA